jgi:hypothetical protein
VVSSTPRPHVTPGKDPVPILQEAGWAAGPVWTGGKFRPHRDSIPDRPARSQLLYRLSYPTHLPQGTSWLLRGDKRYAKHSCEATCSICVSVSRKFRYRLDYRGADKSLARPGRNQAAPVKSVMGRGMDCCG